VTESVIPALATVEDIVKEKVKESPESDNTNITTTEFETNTVKTERLKRVLSNIFPNGTVYWNETLMGQRFLAQVDDILIYLRDSEHPFNLTKFHKEGWKVLVCGTEDLTFPRRLERGLRQIQRSGKKSTTV